MSALGVAPIDVDAPLAWREAGTGDVVLFLHGLGGSRTAWEPQLVALSDRRRCVAWDMPGYGASAAPAGALDFPLLVDAVAAILGELGVAQAHLVGLSLGGMIAQHVAVDRPELVRSLVLVSSSPAFGLDGETTAADWRAARLAPLDAGETPATIAASVLSRIAGADLLEPDALAAAVASMSRIPSAGLRAAVECLPSHDLRDRLGEIRAPTLVIQGLADAETPPAYGRYLAEQIPGARLELIPRAGHLIPHEAPDDLSRLIAGFLDEVER